MSWIKTITSGPFQTNTYLVNSGESDEAILVDAPPGCYDTVVHSLEAENYKLIAVLITHPHFDHTLDASRFAQDNIPIYAHPDAVSGVENPETWDFITMPEAAFPCSFVGEKISGGTTLHLAGMPISVLDVPGHSPGSLAFCLCDACFSGDVIFRGSIGRTDLPGGNFDVLSRSIKRVLYTLDGSTVLYPGHGPSTTVKREKTENPFVRC